MVKRMCLRVGVLAVSIASSAPAWADETQTWVSTQLAVRIAPGWSLSNESTLRLDSDRGAYQLVSSIMASRQVAKGAAFAAGYTRDQGYAHGALVSTENRARQRVSVSEIATFGPAILGGRLLNELRWRDGIEGMGWRLRPSLKLTAPLAGKAAVSFGHESFLNLNSAPFQRMTGLARMRNSLTISAPIGRALKFEGGYLEQHDFIRGGRDTDVHVLTLALSASL